MYICEKKGILFDGTVATNPSWSSNPQKSVPLLIIGTFFFNSSDFRDSRRIYNRKYPIKGVGRRYPTSDQVTCSAAPVTPAHGIYWNWLQQPEPQPHAARD